MVDYSKSIVSLVDFKVSKKPVSAPNTSTKCFSPYIVVYLVKVFAITTAFQDLAFIMKYCPFVSPFGPRILSSIIYKLKKIPRIFQT